MDRNQIISQILCSDIITKWHWFYYHFSFYLRGGEHPFAKSVVDAIHIIGSKVKNADVDFIRKIASINGKEKDKSHYEQLMQVLSEIIIIKQAVLYKWDAFERFEYEPTTDTSLKNPELNICTKKNIIGIEVKSPELLTHELNRSTNPFQLLSRNPFKELLDKDLTTYPRDNPVKDFLISADKKFSSFKSKYKNYISILYIVWDDFIVEPISALLSKPLGIFLPDSFARDKNDEILKFVNVDCIMISRHRYQLQLTAGENLYPYPLLHALDYGSKKVFPFKVIIKNPYSTSNITEEIIDCFQVYEPTHTMGAEYVPSDFTSYINF